MQTTLQVGEDVVQLEYRLDKQVVVFSHGFGVRRDARGLFTDIAAALPRGWGYVLFDYDGFDETHNQLQVGGADGRLARLKAVVAWAQAQTDVKDVHLIGHSMGSLTIASLAPEDVGKLLLLAPPLSLGSRFAETFTKRPGAEHEGSAWSFPRSDGTTTLVEDKVLAELASIDAEGELSKLALFRSYVIILAGSDEMLPDADYTGLITMPAVSMLSIDKANHDFNGEARTELVRTVVEQLKQTVS